MGPTKIYQPLTAFSGLRVSLRHVTTFNSSVDAAPHFSPRASMMYSKSLTLRWLFIFVTANLCEGLGIFVEQDLIGFKSDPRFPIPDQSLPFASHLIAFSLLSTPTSNFIL